MKTELDIEEGTADHLAELQRLFVNTISSVCNADYNAEQIECGLLALKTKNGGMR